MPGLIRFTVFSLSFPKYRPCLSHSLRNSYSFFHSHELTEQRNQPSTVDFVLCAPRRVIDYVESVWPVGERLLIACSVYQCSRGEMNLCNASKYSQEDTQGFFFVFAHLFNISQHLLICCR